MGESPKPGAEIGDVGQINVGLPHYRQLLARPVDAGGVERLNVVDRGDVAGCDQVSEVRTVVNRGGLRNSGGCSSAAV